jgi:signal transduction histidine kinase/putative methionine-R-sulfoxide reductase with GAF domain
MTPKPDTGTQVAIDNARLFEEMESTNRRLFALNQLAQTVNQSLNLRETLAAALDATLEAVEVDAGNIRLWDEQEGVLTIATHRGMSERYIAQRRHFKPGEGIGGKVFQRGEAFLVEDMREYPHLNEMAQEEGVRSVASIPIRSRDKMVGVISIFGHGQRRFTPPELELLTAIGNQIGTAIENARLFETIAQGKREWESTFDAIADGIVLLDERGTVLRANRAFGFWWKTPAEALTGASWHDLWDQLGVSSPCPHCEAWSTKRPASAEAHVSTSNRSLAFAAFLLQAREPSPSKSFAGTILVIRDITERKRAEEALRRTHDEMERGVQERTAELSRAIDILQEQIAERQRVEEQLRRSEDQLRALSGHLRAVQEEERARIAREVHDELGQALTALKIDLAWIAQRLGGEQGDLQTKIQAMTHLVDETVQAVRRIATELRPGLLDHLGLVAALEWQVREFQERTGLTCEFKKNPENLVVDAARATTVFRICQEALTNVARHAQATKVDISLRMAGRKLVLKVRDNGRGISEDAVADPQSVGLLGMRERVLSWGGEVQIQGVEGKGTVVTVHLPAGDEDPGHSGGLS